MGVKLSKAEWKEVREAAEAGASDVRLASDWGITRESIRKRRHDDAQKADPWMTPKEKEKAAAIKAVENFYSGKENGVGLDLVLDPVTETELVEMRTQTPQEIAKRIRELLRKGVGFLRPPATLDEWTKMYNLYEKMLGMNKQGSTVAIQFNGMQWGAGAKDRERPVVAVASS